MRNLSNKKKIMLSGNAVYICKKLLKKEGGTENYSGMFLNCKTVDDIAVSIIENNFPISNKGEWV